MTESLFPPGKQAKADQPPPKRKTYSIDDFLNAPICTVESMLPKKHSNSHRGKQCHDKDYVPHRKMDAKKKEMYRFEDCASIPDPTSKFGGKASHSVRDKPASHSKVCDTYTQEHHLNCVITPTEFYVVL